MSEPAEPGGPPPAAEPQTYEAATARGEEIIRRRDSGEASLDETPQLLSEAKARVALAARRAAAVPRAAPAGGLHPLPHVGVRVGGARPGASAAGQDASRGARSGPTAGHLRGVDAPGRAT